MNPTHTKPECPYNRSTSSLPNGSVLSICCMRLAAAFPNQPLCPILAASRHITGGKEVALGLAPTPSPIASTFVHVRLQEYASSTKIPKTLDRRTGGKKQRMLTGRALCPTCISTSAADMASCMRAVWSTPYILNSQYTFKHVLQCKHIYSVNIMHM
jgi:hypothetical protein